MSDRIGVEFDAVVVVEPSAFPKKSAVPHLCAPVSLALTESWQLFTTPRCRTNFAITTADDLTAGALNVAHGHRVELAGELIETELWKGYGVMV